MKGSGKIKIVLWVLLFMVIIPLSSFGTEGQIEIGQTSSFPIIINQSGNYVLTDDLIVSVPNTHCLQIDADDVILDLDGHILTGPGQGSSMSGSGIYASGKSNIAVMNGTIQGFSCGINLYGTNHELKNITVCNNSSNGVKIESSTLTDCTAANNGSHGFDAEACTITNCTANNNGSHGLDTDSSTITNCTSYNNTIHGIHAAGKCRLEGCILRENSGYGLYLDPEYSYAVKNGAGNNSLGNFYLDGAHYLPTSGDDANYEL